MSDIYSIRTKKNLEILYLSDQIKKEIPVLLNKDSFFENGLCVRNIPGKRETWQISFSEEVYYIKIFWNNIIRKIGFFLGLSKAKKELLTSHSLKNKDILFPEITAYIVEKGRIFTEKEWLITKKIKGGERLRDFVFNVFYNLPKEKQKKIIVDFANYVRKLHDSGIMHKDPHLGNFLIRQEGEKNYFYLLDLSDVVIKPFLSFKDRFSNLSYLNLNFYKHLPKSLRFFFLKNYSHNLFDKAALIQAISTIETQTLSLSKKILAKKIQLCFKSNKLFDALKKGNLKVYIKNEWNRNKDIEQLLSFPDLFFDKCKKFILKDGNTVKAAKLYIDNGKWIFLKRYNKKSLFHTFKNIFRSSRARRVWKMSWAFKLIGIPTPSAIAYIEERKFRILKRSYIISEFIADAVTLSSIFRSKANDYQKKSISIMKTLGREIGKMHKLGCIHGDLKWSNILIKEIDGKHQCFFVDLDSSKIKRSLPLSDIIDDLSRFYVEMLKYKVSLDVQNEFMKSYYKNYGFKIPYEKIVNRIKERLNLD